VKVILRVSRRRAAFVYPVPPAPLTAILVPWFHHRSDSGVRIFSRGWDAEAAAYQPAAIAGTWLQMESLLVHKIESLTHALIVLARSSDSLLTIEQRQQLWRAFRVPVFEQIIGANGVPLAAECEAHAGLHIESPKLKIGGCSIEDAPCGCGRDSHRIKAVEQIADIHAGAVCAS
jgi:hypothetical protein